MKLVHFLYIFVFIILNCINTFANERGYDLILERIKNDTHSCISGDIYDHKQLEKCSKRMPDNDMNIDSGLDVLCMSLYDSFLLLCEGGNQNEKLKKEIPQDLKQFSILVDSLGKDQTADKFCTEVEENEYLKSRNKSFNKTASWINFFISSMKKKNLCVRICSALDEVKLDPLCPFIDWVNKLYSENSNTAVEPLQSSDNKNDGAHMGNDTPGKSSADIGNADIVGANPEPELKPGKGESEDDLGFEAQHDIVGVTESNLTPPGKKVERQKGVQIGQEEQEVQKEKQVAAHSNSSTVETIASADSVVKGTSENDQAAKPKENANEGGPEPEKESAKKGEVSSPNSDVVDIASVAPSKVNVDNDDNGKGINDDGGGIVMSNEEENNENGGEFVIDGHGGADGLEHEEESDDVQIPSSIKEAIPAVPAQNKQQTFNEQAAHAGISKEETDVEGGVIVRSDPFVEAEDSHFFTYFISMAVLSIIMYLVFHNKKKLVALAVEGRRTRSTTRRRPNTASYSKLDCNLEEAMVSNTTASVTHVLY